MARIAPITATAAQPRDELGRYEQTPRFVYLNRYFSDPVFRAQEEAERVAVIARRAIENDAAEVCHRAGPNEPAYVGVFRDRVIDFARRERDHQLLVNAGLSDAEIEKVMR